MSVRLTSFLSSIEHACQCDEPAPKGGSWESSRTINYQLGLARLTLASRGASRQAQPMGSILLQACALADGSNCVKANLSWVDHDGESASVHSVYAKPGTDWEAEARLIASSWLAGPPASKLAPVADEPVEQLAAAM